MHACFRYLAGILILLSLAAPGAHAADPVDPAVAADFRRIIETQLNAFRRNDGETAFAQATPEIRARIGTADAFMAMVRTDYAPVWRPRDYVFEAPLTFPERTAQPVRFIGPDGRGVLGVYYMEQQPDGGWRIAGVYLVPLPERAI